MARKLKEIIAHLRMVAADPTISTTLIQTEDLEVLCIAAEHNAALYHALEMVLDANKSDPHIPKIALATIEAALAPKRAGEIPVFAEPE